MDTLIIRGNRLVKYLGSQTEVAVPEGIEEISGRWIVEKKYDANSDRLIPKWADGAFEGNTCLRRVILPSTLKTIGREAFAGCVALENIVFLGAPETICDEAFRDCRSLRELRIPDGTKAIGNCAFAYCTALTGLTLPESAVNTGIQICRGCMSLKEVVLPPSQDDRILQGSGWYIAKMKARNRCPVCGCAYSHNSNICSNGNCPTNAGKWER